MLSEKKSHSFLTLYKYVYYRYLSISIKSQYITQSSFPFLTGCGLLNAFWPVLFDRFLESCVWTKVFSFLSFLSSFGIFLSLKSSSNSSKSALKLASELTMAGSVGSFLGMRFRGIRLESLVSLSFKGIKIQSKM